MFTATYIGEILDIVDRGYRDGYAVTIIDTEGVEHDYTLNYVGAKAGEIVEVTYFFVRDIKVHYKVQSIRKLSEIGERKIRPSVDIVPQPEDIFLKDVACMPL
jgi:hypothetical protein